MNGNRERMGRGSLAGQEIYKVEERSRTPGSKSNVGLTGKSVAGRKILGSLRNIEIKCWSCEVHSKDPLKPTSHSLNFE